MCDVLLFPRGQTFLITLFDGGGCGYDDDNEEMDVSEENFL